VIAAGLEVATQHTLLREFSKRRSRIAVPLYQEREARNRWAAELLRGNAGRTALNLGGGGARHLGKHLGSRWQVHELDVGGDSDTTLDLDRVERLPFADRSFDVCCALDVLEHLEQFHLIVDEMFRVARSMLLISLPNAAVELPVICRNLRYYNDASQNGVYSKFYGLPLTRPTDRHRWWLTFDDIVRFFLWTERVKSCAVEFYVPDDAFSIKRKLLRLVAGERLFLNLCCSSVWVRVVKESG